MDELRDTHSDDRYLNLGRIVPSEELGDFVTLFAKDRTKEDGAVLLFVHDPAELEAFALKVLERAFELWKRSDA